jgi:hypothetical protein
VFSLLLNKINITIVIASNANLWFNQLKKTSGRSKKSNNNSMDYRISRCRNSTKHTVWDSCNSNKISNKQRYSRCLSWISINTTFTLKAMTNKILKRNHLMLANQQQTLWIRTLRKKGNLRIKGKTQTWLIKYKDSLIIKGLFWKVVHKTNLPKSNKSSHLLQSLFSKGQN